MLVREVLVKNWSYISTDVHFNHFQKTDVSLSRLAHVGENSWEMAKKELSIWRLLLSFLLNCGVQISAETAVIWSRLSDREMGGNIWISNLLKTSAIDVQSARVFPICFFRLHYDSNSATTHSDIRVWWISSCMKAFTFDKNNQIVWRFEGLLNQMHTALHDFYCPGFHWRKFSLMDA